MDAISLAQLVVFMTAVSVAIITPGPAILACAQAAISRGWRATMPYALGLAVGASLWCLLSLLGLSVLFRAVPQLYVVVKVAGGLYLIWIAVQMLRHAGHVPEAADTGRSAPGFMAGLALNLSNPKPALFYGSMLLTVFPQLHGFAGPAVIYLAALACELTFYTLVTTLLSTAPARRAYLGAAKAIDRTAAALIGALGLTLIIRH